MNTMECVISVRRIGATVILISTTIVTYNLIVVTLMVLSKLVFVHSVITPVEGLSRVSDGVTRNSFSRMGGVRCGCSSRVNSLYSTVDSVTLSLRATSRVGGSFVSQMSRRLHAPLATVGN